LKPLRPVTALIVEQEALIAWYGLIVFSELPFKAATRYGFICTVYGAVRTTYTDSVRAIKRTKNTVHGIKTEEFDFLSVFGV
jgi:hypothetical protein